MTTSLTHDCPRALAGGVRLRSRSWQKASERLVIAALMASAAFTILITTTIVAVLFSEAFKFFHMPEVSLGEFLFTAQWNPLLGQDKHFGVWPLICGTMLVTTVAMLLAVPQSISANMHPVACGV